MDKSIILVSILETNGISCPKLIVHSTIRIKDEDVFYREDSDAIYYTPIRLAISYKITDAKWWLNNLKEEKSIIEVTKKHVKLLKNLITHMDKFNETREVKSEQYLEHLYVFDGCDEERVTVKQSYEQQKKKSEDILKQLKEKYTSKQKDIRVKCLKEVSLLLKNNGLRNHKDTAYVLLCANGLEISIHL